ncbi:MAG: acyl carrier protein [Kofleriaceae bacterium]
MRPLADEVLAILCKIAPDVDPRSVNRATPLPDQLDLDSMDYQNLLAALSTQFAIAIDETDVPRLRSIDDLVGYIEARR